MIRPRWHKVLADLGNNKVRSLLVIASIAVGLFAVGIIVGIRSVIMQDMPQGYASVDPANIIIKTRGVFDEDLVTRVRHLNGVKDAGANFTTSLRILTGPNTWEGIDLRAEREFQKIRVTRLDLEQGRWPSAKNEIAIERNKFGDTHAHLGDWVTIELPSGETHTLRLVGIIHDQTVGASGIGGGFFLAPIQGYISHDTLAFLDLPDDFNTLLVTVSGNSNNSAVLSDVAGRVRESVENAGHVIESSNQRGSRNHPNSPYVDAISSVLVWLGLFVVFLSAFLVTNTISALLAQQVQQIGVMKTVGARRYQVINVYMMILFIYGILACAIAIPLSYLACNRILDFLAARINFTLQGYRLVPEAVWLQILIALLVPQVAGFWPILQGVRISVQEAISGQPAAHPVSGTWLDWGLARVRLISRPLRISLRNTFRRKGRLALTLITLSLGGAVFIATFDVRASVTEHIGQIARYFLADVNLTLDRPYRIDRIQQALSAVPGIYFVEGWSESRAEVLLPDGTVGESIHILAAPSDSTLTELAMIKGRKLMPGDQNAVILSELFLSRYPFLKVGSPIRLRISGEDSDWVVTGFFQLAGKSGGFLAYANYEYFAQKIHQAGKAQSFRIVADRPGLTLNQQNALGQAVEQHLRSADYLVRDVQAGSHLYESAGLGLNVLTVFLLIMAILIALVGSIGLAGTMSMNVMERTREIGVMRSIGASDRTLSRLVIAEGMLVGMISCLIGVALSFPMSKLMSDTINRAIFDTTSGFVFNLYGILIWLIVVILLSILASLLPARNATRLTIREVLAYE